MCRSVEVVVVALGAPPWDEKVYYNCSSSKVPPSSSVCTKVGPISPVVITMCTYLTINWIGSLVDFCWVCLVRVEGLGFAVELLLNFSILTEKSVNLRGVVIKLNFKIEFSS